MGIAGIIDDWDAALAALAWQVEAGVDEVLGDAPVNRYELPAEAPRAARGVETAPVRAAVTAPPAAAPATDAVAEAQVAAAAAQTLEELRAAMAAFPHCELRQGARNMVFADGTAAARVMVIGEAPGREEDQEGRPFVGRPGQLLDRMFAAIGLSRSSPDSKHALYLTDVLPWRPLGDHPPQPAEIAMLRPFVQRHIALADPQVIVTMGNTPLGCLTGQSGVLRLRGQWLQALDRPLLVMTHPAYLLQTPAAKREAWADLLSLQQRLRG
ncbi:MAG: uracil-DNA glycosylase [Paracoccaceae bacterium]